MAVLVTREMARTCSRLAISGTTPPNGMCRAIWEETTLASTIRPSRTTAALVSSHDVSMPRMSMLVGASSGRLLGEREGRCQDFDALATVNPAVEPVHQALEALPIRAVEDVLGGHDVGILVVVAVVARA